MVSRRNHIHNPSAEALTTAKKSGQGAPSAGRSGDCLTQNLCAHCISPCLHFTGGEPGPERGSVFAPKDRQCVHAHP